VGRNEKECELKFCYEKEQALNLFFVKVWKCEQSEAKQANNVRA